ncbi:hypothetical protein [Ruegeria atlantica]|uniref:hypothetical protein n=1 Tax=Ruegeria atlantica TaxID=81569 RepID=UPI00147CF4BC|nr:hypothetical protein [Ruegeria atlantica]
MPPEWTPYADRAGMESAYHFDGGFHVRATLDGATICTATPRPEGRKQDFTIWVSDDLDRHQKRKASSLVQSALYQFLGERIRP